MFKMSCQHPLKRRLIKQIRLADKIMIEGESKELNRNHIRLDHIQKWYSEIVSKDDFIYLIGDNNDIDGIIRSTQYISFVIENCIEREAAYKAFLRSSDSKNN